MKTGQKIRTGYKVTLALIAALAWQWTAGCGGGGGGAAQEWVVGMWIEVL